MSIDIALKTIPESLARRATTPRPVSSTVVNKVLSVCNLAYQNPKGETFVCSTPAGARTFRQAIYEVRRFLKEKQGNAEYRPLFESHIKISGCELHIGPHPLSFNEDFALKKPTGELVPLAEALSKSFIPFIAAKPAEPEVTLPLTYMEKFIFAALIQQAASEIIRESRIDPNNLQSVRNIMPQVKRKAAYYFSQEVELNQDLMEVQIWLEDNQDAYEFALKMQEEGL